MIPSSTIRMRAAGLRRPLRRAVGLVLALGLAAPAAVAAQPAAAAVPAPLRPWVPWVLARHPELPCPLVAGERLCAWPGRLRLDLDAAGGAFRLEVVADRDLDLPLPGDAARWPREVTAGGGPALLRRLGERPAVALPAGRHLLAGSFTWTRLPESLPVPPEIALVDLTVGGRPVADPRREAGGLLWLAGERGEEAEEERVAVVAVRRIGDGVPVTQTVRLTLRVSGRPREVTLGAPLPAGFAPTSLASPLPVRLAEGEGGGASRLVAQLRPGEWEVTLEARSLGPVAELAFAGQPPPWPEEELWAFAAAPAVRSVRLEGAPAVDPQRTPLPEAWRSLPAFRLTPGAALALVELRRGQSEPPPDEISAERDWWLAEDGGEITARDSLAGTLHAGGRLEALAPADLGRVALAPGGSDEVITLAPESGRPGVEVRSGELALAADLTYPRRGALPAVGWDRDVQRLALGLHLPPGWTLLAAPGADRAAGAWIDAWTLLDLFFLLLIALATGKLYGWRWGVLALATLGLAWHEPHAGALVAWWLALLPLQALARVLGSGRLGRWLGRLRWLAAAGFAVQLVVFAAAQWRTGVFPQLEFPSWTQDGAPAALPGAPAGARAAGYLGGMAKEAPLEEAPAGPAVDETRMIEQQALPAAPPAKGEPPEASLLRARQVDAAAVAQTGPGVPRWSWRRCSLSWSGPVAADQRLRLLLVGPGLEALLSLARIAGAVLLAFCLLDPRRNRGRSASGGPAAATAAAGLLLLFGAVSAAAQEPAAPPADLLAELERRLTAPPPCHPDCVEVPRLALTAGAAGLAVEAEVHAAAPSAWPLPGPAAAWTPARVTVDGAPAAALRRGDDGFLLLRLPPGVHRVDLSGPARDSFTLQLPLPPRTMAWRGEGWTITGFRPDAPPPGAVRLDRHLPLAGGETSEADLSPWLELTRELDLGIPWLVHNELRRFGPSAAPVSVRVPLLAGESVTTAGVEVEAGEAAVTLERGETARRWRSTLEEAPSLTLLAPQDRPWMERWVLACSPLLSCRAEGLAPTRQMADGLWRPEWQPWPGERLTLHFVRPEAAAGTTLTVDAAHLAVTPGRRLLEGRLSLELRASRAGEEAVALPAEAALQSFAVDGRPQPVQADGGRLTFPVEPGGHAVEVAWRQPHGLGLVERVPAVELRSPAANVTVDLAVPENRWLLWAGGPAWGSVVTLWLYLPLLALAAWALGRFAPTPLATLDWLLLGAGLTQVPLLAAAVVPLWLVLFALRQRFAVRHLWARRLQQALLGLLWLAALAVLYAAVHAGLLGRPEMQIAGPGGGGLLTWYADRAPGPLPRPYALWLPLWVFRLLMLLWALWLSARLLRWLPWAWRRLSAAPEPPEPAAPEGGDGDEGGVQALAGG